MHRPQTVRSSEEAFLLVDDGIAKARPEDVGNPADERTSFGNLIWMSDTVRENAASWPGDKAGRWAGFALGVLADAGFAPSGLLPETEDPRAASEAVASAHLELLTRYAQMAGPSGQDDVFSACQKAVILARGDNPFDLGFRVGLIQGLLCARGVTTADAEREFSRPLLHAAYEAGGVRPPDTLQIS